MTRDALAAERRRLPMVEIEKEYIFEGPDGEARLLDLFGGRRATGTSSKSRTTTAAC